MSNITELISKRDELKTINKSINNVKVKINGYLDAETMANIVQTVAQSSFTDGEYHAENREIARRYCIIKYMTDIELGNANVAEVFKATQCGNWYSPIENEITKLPIWAKVETAIDNQISYLIETRQTAFDKLCADLSAIIKTDNTQNLADVKEVLEKLNKVDKQAFVEAAVEQSVKKTKKK